MAFSLSNNYGSFNADECDDCTEDYADTEWLEDGPFMEDDSDLYVQDHDSDDDPCMWASEQFQSQWD